MYPNHNIYQHQYDQTSYDHSTPYQTEQYDQTPYDHSTPYQTEQYDQTPYDHTHTL